MNVGVLERVSSEPLRVMTILGTRPEAIKLCPIIRGIRDCAFLESIVITSGQHRAILDQVLELFEVQPDEDLAIASPGQTLTDVTTRTLAGLSPVIDRFAPHVVVVQGDTTTTLAGALAAFYAGVPVVHVEAGLRTGNTRSPFPEEMNRRITSQLTSLHLPPTESAKQNLLREGIDPDSIVVTGNSVIDALRWTVERDSPIQDPVVANVTHAHGKVLLVTTHRRESWGRGVHEIAQALADLADFEPDLTIVLPMHPNPIVRDPLLQIIRHRPNVVLTEPLPYGEFAQLLYRADIVLTDSGGIQEEAPSLGKPVLVMRDTTERPEAVEAGAARLVGTSRPNIVSSVRQLLHDPAAYRAMATAVNPFGDGKAVERTVGSILRFFGRGGPVEDFNPARPMPRGGEPIRDHPTDSILSSTLSLVGTR